MSVATTKKPSASMKLVKKGTSKPEAKEEAKAAEVAETAGGAVDTSAGQSMAAEDLIVHTAHEIENLKEEKAFKMVPQLLDSTALSDFKLGGVLSVIQAQGWYMDRGFENFRAYVEGECGINYRKAMYLIAIYNGLVESKVAWDKVKHLGWTKLKELASILTVENVDEWVERAESMTVIQLQEYIKAESAGTAVGTGENSKNVAGAAEASKTTTITFKCHADQKQTVREAIDKAKHETGTDVDTVALEHICLDFLGGQSKLAKMPTLEELMKGKSAEEVLQAFGEVFPDVELTAELPE